MGKRTSRRKTRKKRGGSMVCGVCRTTFEGESADPLLNHCVNAHSEGSRDYISNANSVLLKEVGLNTKKYKHLKLKERIARGLADICASTIPYEFPPHEFEERFVHAKEGDGKSAWSEEEKERGRRSTTREREREEDKLLANLPNKGTPGKQARPSPGRGGPGSGGGKQNHSTNRRLRRRDRKTQKKKKIGGYNSCLNFDNSNKYCKEISENLPHMKGKIRCDTKTGYCINPITGDGNDDSDNDSDDESNHKIRRPKKSARKKNYYSTTNYKGKQKSINSKPYIGGKKKSRKKNKKKLKSRKKRQ